MAKSLEGNPVKAAHAKIEYTEKMLNELSACSDPDDGYMYFITNYGHIKHPSRGMILYEPFDYQYKLLHVYHNYRFSISMVGRQMGKALCGGTPILTVDGYKPLKDIEVGDKVYSELGKPILVTFKTDEQINRDCFKITFSTNEAIIADADHLWKINGYDEPISTKELFGELKDFHITKPNGDLFDEEMVSITSIEFIESVPVYCIEVDNPTHLFLAGKTLIPTHNCVTGDTKIKIRNKNTGEIQEISIKDFHEDNI